MGDLAPIVVFVYNRPKHTASTVEALRSNFLASDSDLFVFADGPKNDASEDQLKAIYETREIFKDITGFKSVTIYESSCNKGLARSIVEGVTKIVDEFGKVIVLEDDLVTSAYFLTYFNDALDTYEDNEKVMHVSGYWYPLELDKILPETFFFNVTSCWGWGTWKRAWKHLELDPQKLMEQLEYSNKLKYFDLEGWGDFKGQLVANISGRMSTWAVRWHASVCLSDGFSLHPRHSLVKNIGFDGTGVNCYDDNGQAQNQKVLDRPINVIKQCATMENGRARARAIQYLQSLNKKPTYLKRVKARIWSLLH
ncbi:glycosyltransferase [Cesiribacter sp. SM1]|uniref:glycosyltransferase n=1 Tax=Cesiribacter sp. SM1 TaxID=2861196 RepID=UPI001CD7E26B|nr:glycosyltransferase [Cesiribacter sp. SM1]